jgi:hypothetical protein
VTVFGDPARARGNPSAPLGLQVPQPVSRIPGTVSPRADSTSPRHNREAAGGQPPEMCRGPIGPDLQGDGALRAAGTGLQQPLRDQPEWTMNCETDTSC